MDINISPQINVDYLSNIIFEAFKLPIIFINKDNTISISRTYNNSFSLLFNDFTEVLKDFLPIDTAVSIPIFRSNKYMENYIHINLIAEGTYLGAFFIGPSLYFSMTPSTIDDMIDENNLSLRMKPQLIDHFAYVPIIEYSRLVNMSVIIYNLIYQKILSLSDLINQNSNLQNPLKLIEGDLIANLSSNRKNTFFHHSKNIEDRLMNCIKDGDIEKLKKHLDTPFDGEHGVLSKKSPIRSEKNIAICCTTLATRAAIDGGLTAELAYTLSDSYIQLIEELKDIKDISNLMNSILIDFTIKVKNSKEPSYSKTVTLCQRFIFNNLYEDITLLTLSTYVGLNPNYISTVFKNETGLTINEYIHQKRIDESKVLLTSTNNSILEISTLLKFHDQSHFSKVFKKITGLSPKKYREKDY
ncbi:MAG: helix-turn-helix domain-containing protein [Clostridium sp.]